MTSFLIAFGVSLVGALAFTPLARLLAHRARVVDRADGERKLHPEPVPLLGGLSLLLAFLAGLGATGALTDFAFGPKLPLPVALAASASLICLIGCWDDIHGLRVRWKLLGQFAATLPLVLSGHALESLEIHGYVINLGWLGIPLTAGWLVTGANAINFLDGVDGLAATLGLVISLAVAFIASSLGHNQAAICALALAGGLTGFLLFNWEPATIYLGDAGSMLIGMSLAWLAVAGADMTTGGTRMVAPLVLLSVPLADIGLAVTRRTLNGRRFWIADRGHMHHQLLERGLGPSEVVGLLAMVCALAGMSCHAAAVHGHELVAWVAMGLLFAGLVRLRFIGSQERALAASLATKWVLRLVAWLTAGRFTRGLPTAADLSNTPFHLAWATLVAEAEAHGVRQLDVRFGASDEIEQRHDWRQSGEAEAPVELWTIDAGFRGEVGWCEIRAWVADGPAENPLNWLSLLDVLRLFVRHWASHPSGTSLGLHVYADDDEQPTLRMGPSPQRPEAA